MGVFIICGDMEKLDHVTVPQSIPSHLFSDSIATEQFCII